jgi:hypothetical protein
MKIYLFLLLILVNLHASAELVYKPMADTAWITSGFLENRGSRYHAGIDYSTEKIIGVAVRSPEAGQIYRVRIAAFGYGKAIYYKGQSGQIWVFAHLDDFSPKLNQWVLQKRIQNKSNRLDLKIPEADQPKYNAGDIIAYSGSTGIGSPHLHLELRRSDDAVVLNPITAGAFILDTIPPKLHHIIYLETDPASRFYGQLFYTPVNSDSIWGLNLPPGSSGELFLNISDYSRAPLQNPMSIYQLQAHCNNQVRFSKSYDQHRYGLMDDIQNDLAWSGDNVNGADYHRVPWATKLNPFRALGQNQKLLNCRDTLPIKIHLTDFKGNTTNYTINSAHTNPQAMKRSPVQRQDSLLFSYLGYGFINPLAHCSDSLASLNFKPNGQQPYNLCRQPSGPRLLKSITTKDGLLKVISQKTKREILIQKSNPDSVLVFKDLTIKFIPAQSSQNPDFFYAVENRISSSDSISSWYEIHPKGIFGQFEYCFKNSANTGIYYRSESSGRWNSFSRSIQKADHLCTTTDEIRDVALWKDTFPPQIHDLKLFQTHLEIGVSDRGSGLSENGINATLDNQWVPVDYDPETQSAKIKFRDLLTPEGKLIIRVKDDSGLKSEKTFQLNKGCCASSL